jgi:hypothetical protein
MQIKINKHSNEREWFTIDFHSFEKSKKIMNFFEERFPAGATKLSPRIRYDEYQISIIFESDEDVSAFKFFWLSNNGVVEIND